jgi:hypothetical protein
MKPHVRNILWGIVTADLTKKKLRWKRLLKGNIFSSLGFSSSFWNFSFSLLHTIGYESLYFVAEFPT